VVFLAGGVGSRVGGLLPKTCQTIPSLGKSSLRHLYDSVSTDCPVAVMVSDDTRDVVEAELGTVPDYFPQESVPCYDESGDLWGIAPSGHGAVYTALQESGILEKWSEDYVDYVIISLSDNPAMQVADPLFVGCYSSNTVLVKVILREEDDPAGLVLKASEDDYFIVDYRSPFWGTSASYGYTGLQMMDINTLKMQSFALPWRSSLSHGVVKYEKHLGDVVEVIPPRFFHVGRDEFTPIKNPSGKWSIQQIEEAAGGSMEVV
jgi:hypothetical protein